MNPWIRICTALIMDKQPTGRVYEKYSDVVGEDYHVYKGIPYPGHHVPAERLEQIPNFEMRSDDILICGYMKSGNHWMKEIVSLIIHGHDTERVKENIFMRAPALEVCPKVMGDPLTTLAKLPTNVPRIMGCHLRPSLLPLGVTKEHKGKVIYVTRNPKDVAVSMYHFHRMNKNLGLYEGTWSQFFHWFLRGEVVFGSWFEYTNEWLEYLQQSNVEVLWVEYENMIKNLQREVSRIAEFLGHPLSPGQVDEISDRCTFSSMSKNPAVNQEDAPFFYSTKSKFLRKGQVGDWKNHFTVAQSELFDQTYQKSMGEYSTEFSFIA